MQYRVKLVQIIRERRGNCALDNVSIPNDLTISECREMPQ